MPKGVARLQRCWAPGTLHAGAAPACDIAHTHWPTLSERQAATVQQHVRGQCSPLRFEVLEPLLTHGKGLQLGGHCRVPGKHLLGTQHALSSQTLGRTVQGL